MHNALIGVRGSWVSRIPASHVSSGPPHSRVAVGYPGNQPTEFKVSVFPHGHPIKDVPTIEGEGQLAACD